MLLWFVYGKFSLSKNITKLNIVDASRFNNIVGQTPELMKNFKLEILPGAEIVGRKIQNIKVNSLTSGVQETLDLHNVRSLELTRFVVHKDVLRKCIASLKLLESLSFENILFDDESSDCLPVELNKLKCLRLNMSDAQILALISTSSLEILSVQTSFLVKVESSLLFNLLTTQSELSQLELYGSVVNSLLMNAESCELTFRLKRFGIGKSSLHEVFSQLQAFLFVHKQTLQDLTIESSLPDQLQVFIFKHLRKLKALKAPITKKLSYLKENSQDTSLDSFPCLQRFVADNLTEKSFLKSLQSLVALDMTSVAQTRPWNDSGALCQLLHLRELRVSEFFLLFPIKFLNLKEFHIHRPVPEKLFENFLRSHCETLEKLVIGWIDGAAFSRGTMVDTIKSCPKLNYISITCDSPIVIRSFSKLAFPHPWTLESKFRSLRKSEMIEVSVVFKFPDDEAVFREKCTTWHDNFVREIYTYDNYGLNAFVNKYK